MPQHEQRFVRALHMTWAPAAGRVKPALIMGGEASASCRGEHVLLRARRFPVLKRSPPHRTAEWGLSCNRATWTCVFFSGDLALEASIFAADERGGDGLAMALALAWRLVMIEGRWEGFGPFGMAHLHSGMLCYGCCASAGSLGPRGSQRRRILCRFVPI